MQHSKCHLISAEFRLSLFLDVNTLFFFGNVLFNIAHDHISIFEYLYYPIDSLKFWSTNVIKAFHIKCCQIRSFLAFPLLDKINKWENIFLLKFDSFNPRISFLGNNFKSWFGELMLSGIFHLKYVFYTFISV